MTVEVVVSSLRTCLICTTPVTIPHYGIEACRACASFFKRAKLTGKKFVCRQGDRNCKIVKDERFMCRSCRYDRCVAHGMMYERASKETTEEKLKKPSCDADSIGPSTSLEPEEKSILRRFGRLYNTSIERRRAQELQLLQDRSDIRLVLHPTQKIYSSNYSDSLRMYDIMLAETRPVYEKAFPAITKLREQDQDTLCKSYISKFCLIDNAHRTRKVWGEFKQFGMRSVLSAVDFTRLDLWLGEDQGGKNRDSLVSYLHDQIQIQCAILGPVLVRAQITTNEFHAILALLLCEIDNSADVAEETLGVLDDIRAEVFENLQRYYKEEMGLSDFSTRLGRLVTLNHAIRECVSFRSQSMRMQQTVFDLYNTDARIKDLFL